MCTPVSWSRLGSILGLLGYFGSIWVGDSVPGRILGTLGFTKSKSLNFEVWKIWGMDVEMALYLRKYKNLVKEVLYCLV